MKKYKVISKLGACVFFFLCDLRCNLLTIDFESEYLIYAHHCSEGSYIFNLRCGILEFVILSSLMISNGVVRKSKAFRRPGYIL